MPKKNLGWIIPFLLVLFFVLVILALVSNALADVEVNLTNQTEAMPGCSSPPCLNFFGDILNITTFPSWQTVFSNYNCTFQPVEGNTLQGSYYMLTCYAPFDIRREEADLVPVPRALLGGLDPREIKAIRENNSNLAVQNWFLMALLVIVSVILIGYYLSENWT